MKQNKALNSTSERKTSALELRLRQQKWWLVLEKIWQNNKEPISLWVGFRLALLIAPMFVATLMPMGNDVLVRGIFNNPTLDRTIGSWTRWDGVIYLDIAQNGYYEPVRMSFYPLYPLLMRAVSFIINPLDSANYLSLSIAGIIVSSLAVLAMCLLLYNLARYEYNLEIARLTILYLLIFPTAFFLWAVYTESLFLALAIGAFYAARINRWLLAMVLAGFCILTKNQGIFIPAALLLEYLHQIGWNPRKLDRRIFYFAVPAGFLSFWLAFNWLLYANPLQFLKSIEAFNRQFSLPWDTLIRAVSSFEFPLTFCFIILFFTGIYLVIKGKFRASYLVFWAGCIAQPLFFPFPGIELFSMLRYLLIIFPAFFLLALISKRYPLFHYTYLVFCFVLYGTLMLRFIMWHWVA
jgi:Gpi18-like mannosyltransferase